MSHPPIPPNAEYYFKDDQFTDGHNFLAIDNAEKYWRPIIAAVASMYWRKEAERIICSDRTFLDKRTTPLANEAKYNAAAWERWGEGEQG